MPRTTLANKTISLRAVYGIRLESRVTFVTLPKIAKAAGRRKIVFMACADKIVVTYCPYCRNNFSIWDPVGLNNVPSYSSISSIGIPECLNIPCRGLARIYIFSRTRRAWPRPLISPPLKSRKHLFERSKRDNTSPSFTAFPRTVYGTPKISRLTRFARPELT